MIKRKWRNSPTASNRQKKIVQVWFRALILTDESMKETPHGEPPPPASPKKQTNKKQTTTTTKTEKLNKTTIKLQQQQQKQPKTEKNKESNNYQTVFLFSAVFSPDHLPK